MLGLTGCVGYILSRHPDEACKRRETAYRARAEALDRNAQEKLKIGTKKDDVIRFFAENGLPLTFTRAEALGDIHVEGCAPTGCGSDKAILGVHVKVDESGTVVSKPVVGGIYKNCL